MCSAALRGWAVTLIWHLTEPSAHGEPAGTDHADRVARRPGKARRLADRGRHPAVARGGIVCDRPADGNGGKAPAWSGCDRPAARTGPPLQAPAARSNRQVAGL